MKMRKRGRSDDEQKKNQRGPLPSHLQLIGNAHILRRHLARKERDSATNNGHGEREMAGEFRGEELCFIDVRELRG